MALHQKFSIGGGTIEFHVASAPGEQFIGQNAQGPSETATPPPANVVAAKQTVITTPFQKIVNPA
jgi:hypothetical protein